MGLSPRVRGNRRRVLPRGRGRWSIPACAGEPVRVRAVNVSGKVYPRVCGGTRVFIGIGLRGMGLSPRVRGNQIRFKILDESERSIPACAGEPRRLTDTNFLRQVYPRVCGGTRAIGELVPLVYGLSPRVRGNLRCSRRVLHPLGSIPACAGEPGGTQAGDPHHRVYPRVCGGTSIAVPESWTLPGLSPRVRGNLMDVVPLANLLRSIPACAGEPLGLVGICGVGLVYPRVCGGTGIRPEAPMVG